MRRLIAFVIIIPIFTYSPEARITPGLADQIYNAAPYDMISCIVVMNTRYPYGKMRSEQVRSRTNVIRKLLSLRYRYRKLST